MSEIKITTAGGANGSKPLAEPMASVAVLPKCQCGALPVMFVGERGYCQRCWTKEIPLQYANEIREPARDILLSGWTTVLADLRARLTETERMELARVLAGPPK